MNPISSSEMEIRNMKRKELQALCKKHNIPANLTNLEMANRLVSLLKEENKPMSKGRSCMRSTLEQAGDNLSDGVKKLSKKVRFSPENETFEFMASEIKRGEIGRRERAMKRSMMKRVEGIAGIVTEKNVDNVKHIEDIVNKPIKVTLSKGKTISNEVENGVKTKYVKRGQKSVAVESVSMVETRVSTRSLKIKEVEKKEEPEDDALLRKNPTKRTIRKRGVQKDNEVSEIEVASIKKTEAVKDDVALKKNEPQITRSSRVVKSDHEVKVNKRLREDEGLAETEKVELVRRGRTKRQRAQLVDDASIKLAGPKTDCKLEVVLQIEEPLRRSSRYGNSRQSVVPQTEKMSIDESKNETETMNNTLISKDAKAKRSSSRRKSVAVSDSILAENDIYKKPRNRRGDQVFEEENNVIKGSSGVEEPAMCSRRNGNRRHSIMPQTEKAGADGSKGKKDKNISNRSAVEETAKSTRNSLRRKSVLASDLTVSENARQHKSTSRRMDLILEEENAAIEGSPVEERPRNEVQKALVTDGTGESVESIAVAEFHAQSVPLEKSIAVAENVSGPLLNSTEVLSKNLEVINVPKTSGLVETASDFEKLQKYHEEIEGSIGVSGTSCLKVVLNIDNEYKADNDKAFEDFDSNILAPEFEVESNDVDLAEDSLGGSSSCFEPVKQVELLDLERETENIKNNESETRASGSLKFQNDDEETQGMPAKEDDSDHDNLALLEPEVESKEDHSRIDQPDCTDEILGLKELQMAENNDMGKYTDLSGAVSHYAMDVENSYGTEEKHFVDPEVHFGSSHVEKSTSSEVAGRERHESGKPTYLSGGVFHDGADVENSCTREEKHFVEFEGVLDNSSGRKYTPREVEGIIRPGVERSASVRELHESLIGKQKPSVEPEVDEDLEHNVEGCLAQNKGINSMKDFFENANEELKDSRVHSTDRKEDTPSQTKEMMFDEVENPAIIEPTDVEELANEFDAENCSAQDKGSVLKDTPSQTKEMMIDEVENPAIIEPTDVEELANKFDAEGRSAQDKESVLKENFKTVNEENMDSSLLDTSEQKEISAFQVGAKHKDEVEISALGSDLLECVDSSTPSFIVEREAEVETLVMDSSATVKVLAVADPVYLEQNTAESVQSPSVTSRDKASCLKEQNHSMREATPISVSNEIKSLMMVNLDWTPSSEFNKAHADLIPQEDEDHALSAFATVGPSEDQNKVIVENLSGAMRHSPLPCESVDMPSISFPLCEDFGMENPESSLFADKLIEFQETCGSSEQSRNQSFGYDHSTEPVESESTENEFDKGVNTMSAENETQPFDASSPETTSGFAEDQGNGSTDFEVSPTELRLLFDDKTQQDVDSGVLAEFNNDDDASNKGLFLGNNFTTEEECIRKVVVEEEELSPIEFKYEGTQVVGDFDDNSSADSPCVETNASSSALACSSKFNFPQEKSEGKKEVVSEQVVSEQGHDDIAKEINSPRVSENIADDNALDNATSYVGKADIADKDSENVPMEDRDPRIHEELTPVASYEVARELDDNFRSTSDTLTNEKKNEDIVNVSQELEGVETQYDDGMFDDLDGDEMEIVQEHVHIEKDDSSCSSDQFLGHEKVSVEVNATTSTDNFFEEEETDVKEIAANDIANYASNETLEFEECIKSTEILTTRADTADGSHNHSSNDMTQWVDESKGYAEYQHSSKVSECWSPDPEFGISRASLDSNMLSNWELNLFSEGEATRSASVGSKVPFTEEEDTGFEACVNEETKTCDEVRAELNVQCEDAKLSESVIEDKSFEYADGAFHGDQVIDINPADKSEQCNSSSMTLGDVVADFEEHFRSESNDCEGELRTAAEVDDVMGLDMFDDQRLADFPLFPTEEENTVSEQVAREMTRSETCPRELSEEVATETKDVVIQKHISEDIVRSSDYLGEHTEVENISQDFAPNAAGDDSTLVSSSFDKGQPFEIAYSGFAAEDVEKNPELADVENAYAIDEKGELSSYETTSNILKTGKQSNLICGTPKKLATAFDMKENVTSVKRENVGSVTAKSIVKRRALSELHK